MLRNSSYIIRVRLAGCAIAACGTREVSRDAVFIVLNLEV